MNTDAKERLLYVRSTHWIKYVGTAVFCHIFLLVGVLLVGLALGPALQFRMFAFVLFLVGAFIILLAHHAFFHKVFSEELDDIIITDQRIIYYNDNLFFCDDEHEIPLQKVAAVQVQQHGLFQNILGYGTLLFDTGGSVGIDLQRSIPHVSRPGYVSGIVTKVVEENEE